MSIVSKAETSDLHAASSEVFRVEAAPAAAPALRVGWGWIMRGNLERALSVLSPLILLGLWELAARVGKIDTRFFPAPTSIFQTAGTLIQTGELWNNVSVSLMRIGIGFTI